MVDSDKVLIDNYNENSTSKSKSEPISTAKTIPMSEILSEHSSELNGGSSSSSLETVKNNCEKNGEELYEKLDDLGEIMCGSSPMQELSNNEIPCCANVLQPYSVTQNGNPSPITITDIESLTMSTNTECSIVNNQQKINKSNDSSKHYKETTTSTSNNSTDQHKAHKNSVEFQSNAILGVKNIITNKMDSRKVEPIRININRDPIKTKIKLGPSSHDCQTVSLKSSSSNSNNDECDNTSEITHENTQNYPKITIKPIIKPTTNYHHNQNNAGSQATSSSSASHEAIPKLKIKKVDSSSTANNQTPKPTLVAASNNDELTTNYQTHLLSESSTTVPT